MIALLADGIHISKNTLELTVLVLVIAVAVLYLFRGVRR